MSVLNDMNIVNCHDLYLSLKTKNDKTINPTCRPIASHKVINNEHSQHSSFYNTRYYVLCLFILRWHVFCFSVMTRLKQQIEFWYYVMMRLSYYSLYFMITWCDNVVLQAYIFAWNDIIRVYHIRFHNNDSRTAAEVFNTNVQISFISPWTRIYGMYDKLC